MVFPIVLTQMRDDVAGALLFVGEFRKSPHLPKELHGRIPFTGKSNHKWNLILTTEGL